MAFTIATFNTNSAQWGATSMLPGVGTEVLSTRITARYEHKPCDDKGLSGVAVVTNYAAQQESRPC